MAIFGVYLNYRLLRLLKEKHTDIWDELGRPDFLRNSIKNNLKVLKFLQTRQYAKLNNPKLSKICVALYNYSIAYLLFFIIALIVFSMNIRP